MEQLKELRTRKGYSQQELADLADIAQHTISEIELGRRKPQGRTLRKIAAALEVDVEELTSSPKATAPPSPEPEKVSEEERRLLSREYLSPLVAMVEDLEQRAVILRGKAGENRLSAETLNEFARTVAAVQRVLY